MAANATTANKYRSEIGRDGGVVIFWQGKVQGWVNQLRDPDQWAPGCIAIDEHGDKFIAVGGNEADGAEEWKEK